MAKGFNLTAQLNIQGPNNLKPVISKLKTALDSVNGNINIKISGTSTKTINGLTTALQSLSKASIQTNANLLTLNQTIGSLGSGLASLGGASSGIAGLGKVTSSVSSTKKAVVEATSALADFGKQSGLALKRFAAFTAVSTAAFSLGAAIKSGFQEFVVFDKEIVRLAQVTGKSTKELGGITKEITRLSTGLGVASADLLQVTTTLAQAGLTAGETKIALEALAKSALAPSFDSLKETTEGSIAAMRQFGIQAGELEAALGSVNAVAAAFAVESSDIITAIQRTGGVFASSSKGVSQGTDALNEFIAVFTSIRATTRESAETIATGLRTIFTRIQRGDTIEALKEYGIVLTDLKGKFVGPYEATRRLSEGLKSLDPRDLKFSKIVEELGGFRQIGKVIPLIKEFASAEAALEVAYKGQSSLAKDAAIAQQSLAVQFTKTRESFVALIRDIGDSASFKVFITLGLGLANAFITLAGALKPLLPMLLTLATIKIGSSIGEYSRNFMSGFSGKPKGKSGGGVIGFARGGFVPGSGSGDTIPAMLEPGEFVIRKKAVDTLGASNLHRMNKSSGGNIRVGGYSGGGAVQKFAGGGIASFGGNTAKSTVLTDGSNLLGLAQDTFRYPIFEQRTIDIVRDKTTGKFTAEGKSLLSPSVDKLLKNNAASAKIWEQIVANVTGSKLANSSNANYPIDSLSGNKLYDAKFKLFGTDKPEDANQKVLNYYLDEQLATKGYNTSGGKNQIDLKGQMLGKHKLTTGRDDIQEPYDFSFVYPHFTDMTTQQRSIQAGINKRKTQKTSLDAVKKSGKLTDDQRTLEQHVDRAIAATHDASGEQQPYWTGGKEILNEIIRYQPKKQPVRASLGGVIQKFMAGGIVERKVGYLDTDVLRDPANQEVVGPAMQGLNLTDVAAYKAYLSKLAASSRKEGSLAKLRTIAGLPGAGKSSLMLGGSQSEVSDNAKLRRTTRFPILRPEDIKLASEVIDTTSTVTPEKLDEYLKASDKIYMLSTSTKEEQTELKRRRGLRDTTGVNLFGRKPGSTSGAETDSGSLEAMLGSDIDASKLRTLGISSDYKLRRKENIEVEKKKIALLHGSLSPSTVGHESLRTAATAMGMPIEDFLVLISSDEGITSADSHSLRTAVFDQDFRVLAAQAAFKGSMVSKQTNRGFTLPDVMEISQGASGQRRFVRPTKDSLGMMVAGENKNIKKYTDKDYKPVQIPRTGGVSGTMARESILDGNLEEMKKILSPDVFSLVSKHLPQLKNRSSILPRIVEHAQKRQAYSLADITKELDSLPQRIDSKKVAKDPEYAAMAAQVKELRNRRDKINSRASFEPFSILRHLAKRYPETYGLQGDTTLSQAVRESVRGQGIVAAKTMPINPGGAEGAKPKTGLPATAAQISNMLQGSNMPEDSSLGEFSGVDITDDMVRRTWRAGYDKSMSSDKAASYGAVRDYFLQQFNTNKEMQAAKLAKRIRKSTKVGLVGLLPFDHSEDRPPIDIKGTDVTMYERGLDSQFAPQVEAMQAYQAAGVNKFAADIQMQASTGGLSSGQKMVYDFDQTLVTGADLFDSKGNIDILGYSDLDRVGAALKKGELTLLGLNLKQKLDTYPELLDNLRISTARPPTNKDLIAKRLAELGLNIPADKITGMNGADKSKNLADNETIVDDNIKTIERVRKAGKSGIEYAPIKSGLSDQQSMATGQANIEGAVIEQAMALFGAPIIDGARATRAIDYPNGLGPAASYFPGIGRDWPTEVKRTIDSDSRSQAIDEFTRYLFPEQVPVGKNLGGSIQKFAMGGASSDTVPAMLTPGEFVINKKAARSIGYGKLNKMNHADSVQGFASGGPVGGVQYFKDGTSVLSAAATVYESSFPADFKKNEETLKKHAEDLNSYVEKFFDAFSELPDVALELGLRLDELKAQDDKTAAMTQKRDASFVGSGVTRGQPEKPTKAIEFNVIAAAAATSILTSKLQELSATFAKSNSSIATGLGGLVSALEAGSSAMLSISVAKEVAMQNNPELAKALEDPKSKASKALSFGTAAVVGVSAVGAGVSAVANKVLDTALAKNTKSLSDFDKSVQDLKDATDADAKSEARKKVQESFFALSKQINSSKDTIANAKSVKSLADGAVTAGTALVTTATTLSMLLPLFQQLGKLIPALGVMGTAIFTLVAGITAPVWGTIAAVVVGVGVALGALGYAFGFFEKSVVQVSPELTALAKAASAAAAANNALSLSSSEYSSQQLAAARIIKATAKNKGQSDESMRATFAQVGLPTALQGNAQPNLANIYREEASGGFNINPVNVALIEFITDAIKSMNPNLNLAEKSLEDAIGMAGKTAKDAVKKGKDAYIESAYSKILDLDPSKSMDELIGARTFGGNTRQSTPENVVLQNKLLALQRQPGMGRGFTGRNLGYGQFTEEGKIEARKMIVESASKNDNFTQVNGDLVKSGVKAVDVGLINLANTLKLFSSAIKKTTDDLASNISLVNEQTAMYFGEGKIEAQKYNKEISVLSNPSAATPDEIRGAYKGLRQTFSDQKVGSPAALGVIDRMESNTLALSSAEQQLPAIIKAINKDYGIGRGDAMQRIADEMTATVATAGNLSPSSPQMREYNDSLSRSLNDTNDTMSAESLKAFTKAYGDGIDSLTKSTEEAKAAYESVAKSNQLIADQQNSIVSKSLKNMELGFTKFNVGNQFAIEKMRLFGDSIPLDMLNAPVDNQLKTLTGGMTDPTSIAATYAQKSAEAAVEENPDKKIALQTEAERFKQALDLLVTNTDRAQNAMGKAAERLNELKTKRNLLESILTGGAAKRNEMREFNNALVRLNSGDKSRLPTDYLTIMKNIGMLGEKQQENIRARFAEMSEFSDPAVRGALNPKTDASLQESLAQAAKDVAVQTEAIALKIALNDTGIKTLTDSIVALTKAVDAENARKLAQIEGKTAETLSKITSPRTTTPQDQSSMKQDPVSLIGDSGGLIKKFGADIESEYSRWWNNLGKEDMGNLQISRKMLSEKAFQKPEDGGAGLTAYDPTTEKGFAYLNLQIQTLQAAITANNSEVGPISSMGPLMTKTLEGLIDRLAAATEARARGISDGKSKISTVPPAPQTVQPVDPNYGVRTNSLTPPLNQAPAPTNPQPALPTQTAPSTDTTSNTKLFAPFVTAVATLTGAMKTFQAAIAPTTTDTTSPTPNSPLNGVGIFKDSVASFASAIQALEQVKIETVAKVNVINEVFVSGETTLSQAVIDKIGEAYAMNTQEKIDKNNNKLMTFGNNMS